MKRLLIITLLLMQSCILYAQQTEWISPDGKKRVYVSKKEKNKYQVMVNSVAHKSYQEILNQMVYFITDSCKVMYIAKRDRNYYVIVDGMEQSWEVILSPNGKHWAYKGIETRLLDSDLGNLKGTQVYVYYVVDGVEQPRYRSVDDFTFSPNGKHWSYWAETYTEIFIVQDGVEKNSYGPLTHMRTVHKINRSPDGKHEFIRVHSDNKYFIVVDGLELSSHYDWIGSEGVNFSPDGKRWYFQARDHGKSFWVIDGVEQPHYDLLYDEGTYLKPRDINFSPDCGHWSYLAIDKKKWFYAIDGVEQPHHDRIDKRGFIFSQDSQHWAYHANKRNKWSCCTGDFETSVQKPDLCGQFNQNETPAPESYSIGIPYIGFSMKDLSGVLEPQGIRGSFDGTMKLNYIHVFNVCIGYASLISTKPQRQAWELSLAYGKPNTTFNNKTELHGHYLSIDLRTRRYYFSYNDLQPFYLLGVSYSALLIDKGWVSYPGYNGEYCDFSAFDAFDWVGIAAGMGISYAVTPYIQFHGSLSCDLFLGGGSPDDMLGGGSFEKNVNFRKFNFDFGFEFDL